MQHAHLFDVEFMSPVWPSGRLPAADSLIQTLGKLWFATWMASCLLVGKKDILQHSLEAIARSENTRCFFVGQNNTQSVSLKTHFAWVVGWKESGPNVCQAEWIDVSYKEMQPQSLKLEVLPVWESQFHCWSRIIHSESETTYLSGPWWIPVVKHRLVFWRSRRFSNQSSKTRDHQRSVWSSKAWNLCATLPMCCGASRCFVP